MSRRIRRRSGYEEARWAIWRSCSCSAGQVRRGGADVPPRARWVRRRRSGRRIPSTLGTVGNLAILLDEQGKLDEAEPLYRRALAGKEEALGPAHPDTQSAELLREQSGQGGPAL